jgi:hypothetical protein
MRRRRTIIIQDASTLIVHSQQPVLKGVVQQQPMPQVVIQQQPAAQVQYQVQQQQQLAQAQLQITTLPAQTQALLTSRCRTAIPSHPSVSPANT